MIKVLFVEGYPKVPLIDIHRFTDFQNRPEELESWRRHFRDKGIKTAIGMTGQGYALFTEHECLTANQRKGKK